MEERGKCRGKLKERVEKNLKPLLENS